MLVIGSSRLSEALREMGHWGICIIEPVGILQWIECHPGLAGYLQAMGGVLAVLVAVFAPQIAARFQQKQLQAEANENTGRWVKVLDAAMPSVVDMCAELSFKIRTQTCPPAGGNLWSEWFQTIAYVMPYELSHAEVMTRGFDPSKVSVYVFVARCIMGYNNLRSQIQFTPQNADHENWTALQENLLAELRTASDAAVVAYGWNEPKWRWRFWQRLPYRKVLCTAW